MPTYMVVHRHSAEDCSKVGPALEGYSSPNKGQPFLCSCPAGFHVGYIVAQADSAEKALEVLPPTLRATSTAEEVTETTLP